MTLESTLNKVKADIVQGNLGKARDRLHGLISSYPNNLALRKQLGYIYWNLDYPAMAGRYWYLEEDSTPEMRFARKAFEKGCAGDPYLIRNSLKFKGNVDEIESAFAVEILESLEESAVRPIRKGKVVPSKPAYPAYNDKKVSRDLGIIAVVAIVILALIVIGLITVINWIFQGITA